MITSKQRAYLRGMANTIEPLFQIGKGGIGENLVSVVNDALEKHEIVKIHVLENAFSDTRDICRELSELTRSEPVQVIGSRFVLYRQSAENRRIYLDKLIVKADAPKKNEKKVKPAYKAKAAYFKSLEAEKKQIKNQAPEKGSLVFYLLI